MIRSRYRWPEGLIGNRLSSPRSGASKSHRDSQGSRIGLVPILEDERGETPQRIGLSEPTLLERETLTVARRTV